MSALSLVSRSPESPEAIGFRSTKIIIANHLNAPYLLKPGTLVEVP